MNLAVMLKSDQCNDMELSGRYAAYNPYPHLESEVSHISTSATKGRQKIYKLSIGNSGNGPTGAITLALPDFIKSLSGTTIKSLAYGETTTITLGITPADDAAVNVSVSGRIGINCANGNVSLFLMTSTLYRKRPARCMWMYVTNSLITLTVRHR